MIPYIPMTVAGFRQNTVKVM